MCAAVAAGECRSLTEAGEAMRGAVTWQDPDAARRRHYDDLCGGYVDEERRLLPADLDP